MEERRRLEDYVKANCVLRHECDSYRKDYDLQLLQGSKDFATIKAQLKIIMAANGLILASIVGVFFDVIISR